MFEKTTLEDLHSILSGSVMRYDNQPVLIANLTGPEDTPIIAYYLKSGNVFTSHWNDPKWNFEPVPLGFINVEAHKSCYYLGRGVGRQFKVGLTTDNSIVSTLNKRIGDMAMNIRRWISSERKNTSLHNTIVGAYPSLNTAYESLEEGLFTHIAVSREFAIDKNYCLYFRDNMVGVLDGNGTPSFARNKDYLNMFWRNVNVGA